jgi:hypothetical protein
MTRTLLLIVLCALLASCAKKKNTYPETGIPLKDTFYYLNNNNPYPLHADIYTNSTNRCNMTNAVYTCIVPAREKYKIPWSAVDPTTPYLYDIYTDDYLHSNWGNDMSGISFISRGNPPVFDLNLLPLSSARYYLLNGNNEQTSWRGLDTARHLRMQINRSKTITISYYDPFFLTYVNDTGIVYNVSQYDKYCAVSIANFSKGLYSYIYNTPAKPQTTDPRLHSSIDTITFSHLGYDWPMVREK